MEKQYAPSAKEKKTAKKQTDSLKTAAPIEVKKEEITDVKTEANTETPVETKKEVKQEKKTPKDKAIVHGYSMTISSKHSYCICKMIKGKSIDAAIQMLEEVLIKKRAVPMNGMEIPHRHGMMSGRYPKNASKEFILLLKQLKANANVNEVNQPVITLAVANRGNRHYKRGGVRSKSTHILMEVMDKTKLNIKNKK